MAAKYWWVSIPVAIGIWYAVKERREAGKAQPNHLITDIGMIITPAISLVLLSEFVAAQQTGNPAQAAAVAAQGAAGLGAAREAAWSPTPTSAPPRHVPMQMPRGAVPIEQAETDPLVSILGNR